jgi:hypothetical protein
MGYEHPQVEFLDPEDGLDGADEVHWLDEEGLGSHRGGVLPPRTTSRRVAGSALVFAVGLALTGLPGVAAYRHDQRVAAAANALILREVNVGDAVTLTDPGRLGGADAWRIEPSAAIAIGVTNESPDPITLLPGSTLSGAGLAGPSTLAPAGGAVLAPGQSGRLAGTVTVNCAALASPAGNGAPGPVRRAAHGNTLLVQARTASGAVGVAALDVGAGAAPVRDQICDQEGQSLATSFFPVSVNAASHDFTVAVSARSLAAKPLKYWVTASFQNGPGASAGGPDRLSVVMSGGRPVLPSLSMDEVEALLPGVRLADPTPVGPIDGTLAPGASTTAGFTLHVRACPVSPPTSTPALTLEVFLDDHGQPAYFQTDSFELDNLVAAACGLIA